MSEAVTPSPSGRVLVLGARGYFGANLVECLRRRGLAVRAADRNTRPLEARDWGDVEIVHADALSPETLVPALRDVDVAYYLVPALAVGKDFSKLELHAAQNFARAAAEAGLSCIVYLGTLFPQDADSEHLLARHETGGVLRAGPVPVIEVRAGVVVGPGSAAFEILRDLVIRLPLMVTPRWVRRRSPPIALDNLVEYLARLPQIPEAAGRIFEAGGPESLTFTDMMRTLARILGRHRPVIIPVPVSLPRLASRWLWLVTGVPTAVARALVEGLRRDFTADDAELRKLVPQELMSFEQSALAVLDAERRRDVQCRWTEEAQPVPGLGREHGFYAKRADGSSTTSASPESVWDVVKRIGGRNRYYGSDVLWWLRETIDWLIGGPGRHRGRRDPDNLRVGDSVDSWTVIDVEPARRLTMRMGMKALGSGVLELDLEPLSQGGTRITATAYWEPAGLGGLVYWYALFPAHLFIFDTMTRNICRLAEAREQTAAT
jgi:uncharacterized protein YbjT (DUF2867 family)/uncharacterized protein YndB with AHSA1/START domain